MNSNALFAPICIIVILCTIQVLAARGRSDGFENIPCFYQARGSVVNRDVDERECRTRRCCDELFPKTYFTKDPVDMRQLARRHGAGQWFIQKKIWGSERKGLKLVQYGGPYDTRYEHIQELITNSLKVQGRAFHLRLYLVVDCKHGLFLCRDGEMKYCGERFDPQHVRKQNVVSDLDASGRMTYAYQYQSFLDGAGLPKTLSDLYFDLNGAGYDSQRLESKLRTLFSSYVAMKHFCKVAEEARCPVIHKDDYKFYRGTAGYKYKHIYGADVIVKSDLTPLILEVNQRPTTLNMPQHPELKYRIPLRQRLLDSVKEGHYPDSWFVRLTDRN